MSDGLQNYLGNRPWWAFWLNLLNFIFWFIVSIVTFEALSITGIFVGLGLLISYLLIEYRVGRWQEQHPSKRKN